MRLLNVVGKKDMPEHFRDHYVVLAVEATPQELAYGHHDELTLFDVRMTDVEVVMYRNRVMLGIKTAQHMQPAFDVSKCDTEAYRQWMGEMKAPPVEVLLHAHMIKTAMPTLHEDLDAFVWFFSDQIKSIEHFDASRLVFSGSELIDTQTDVRYDLWSMLRHYLMLDGKIHIGHSDQFGLNLNDHHVSEKGVSWWLAMYNESLMTIGKNNGLLALFITFNMEGDHREVVYNFVTKHGDLSTKQVDPDVFMHLAMHGKFPKVCVEDTGSDIEVSVLYGDYFSERFNTFMDNVLPAPDFVRNLVRFI